MQQYTLKCLISYLLSNCFSSEFCKHIWTKRKLARRAAWHVVRNEVSILIGWKKQQPVNQVPSTEWTIIYSKVVMSCGRPVSPNLFKKKKRFCTVQYRCIFVFVSCVVVGGNHALLWVQEKPTRAMHCPEERDERGGEWCKIGKQIHKGMKDIKKYEYEGWGIERIERALEGV